jgi:hypothetical protein
MNTVELLLQFAHFSQKIDRSEIKEVRPAKIQMIQIQITQKFHFVGGVL